MSVRAKYHKRDTSWLLVDYSSDGFHLFFIPSDRSVEWCNPGNLARRNSDSALDMLGTREEKPWWVIFVRQCLMHSPKRQAIELEAYVEPCSTKHAEAVAEVEADVISMHLMYPPFIPGAGVERFHGPSTTNENVISNQNRRSVFSKAFDLQST